jgi:hypothetical protein
MSQDYNLSLQDFVAATHEALDAIRSNCAEQTFYASDSASWSHYWTLRGIRAAVVLLDQKCEDWADSCASYDHKAAINSFSRMFVSYPIESHPVVTEYATSVTLATLVRVKEEVAAAAAEQRAPMATRMVPFLRAEG